MANRKIIRFLAEVNQQSANALIGTVENLIRGGIKDILLLFHHQVERFFMAYLFIIF